MSNINKKSTLVYNGGSFKFKNTEGNNFRSFEILTNAGFKKIEQLLDLDSNSDNTVYSLEYKNNLNSYNIKNFFFFYQEILEDTKMDLSSLMVKDDSKVFLVFVDIAKDSRLIVEGTYKWNGEIPVFESGNKYLFLVQKKDDSSLVLTLIAKSVSRNNVLTLVFRIRKGEETLDLRSTFPEYIYCFKPRYNFKITWGDEEESSSEGVFSNGIKNLIHTYNVELEDDRSSHVDVTVKIIGVCEGLGQVPHNCIRCEESRGIKYFGKCFSYCPEFYEFPETFFHSIGEQSELHGCFQGTSISKIPENIFPENNHIKRIVSLFSECVKLDDTKSDTSIIPENLFKPLKGLEELISVFDSSYYISKVPKNILKNNPKLKNVERCFALMGLDQGENKSSATIKDWIIDNIPEGIVDGKNIKNTEATFSGLGLGRVIRHVDDKNNPHETTLQKAYEVQQTSNSNVELNVNRGIQIKKPVRDSSFSNYELIHGIGRYSDMVLSGIKNQNGDFLGFSTDIVDGLVSNSVVGSPLTLFSPAVENNQAVTLKQLRDAELNGLELIGTWIINENTTDYSTLGNKINTSNSNNILTNDEKFKVGAFYYVKVENDKSSRIEIDNVWWSTGDFLLIIGPKGNGWTSSGETPNIAKIENNPSIKSVFENKNVSEATAHIGEVTKKVIKNGYVLFQLPANTDENTILKNDNDKGFEIKSNGDITVNGNIVSNGNISLDGIISQSAMPVKSDHLTNKEYVDSYVLNEFIKIKSLDNINEDKTKVDSAWSGINLFENQTFFEDYITINGQADFSNKVDFGSSDIGWFRFNFVNKDENLKRFEFVNSSKETSYRLDCKNSSVEQVFEMTGGETDYRESLTLDLNKNLFEKTYDNISVKTNKEGFNNFESNEFITKGVVNEVIGDFSKNFVLEKGISRDVNFSGFPNSAQSNGCRFVVKSANISGLIRVSELKFFTPNDNRGTVADCDLMIGIYKMNSESGVNENGVKYSRWHYPEKLVAYSIDKGVRNIRGQEIVFSHLVQAQPRKEGQQRESHVGLSIGPNNLQLNDSGQLVLDENGNPIPINFEYPHEFIPNSEDEVVHPDDSENPGFYWDASEAMMVVFFKQELNDDEDQSIKKLPPILGKYITGVEYQSYAPFANGRFESFSTVNYQTEVTSVYTYNDANWAFIPTKPRVIKYNGENHCLKMVLKAKGVNELHAFGVNTTGNYITGTSNVWTGSYNDFYGSTLLYKKGTTDTEVATIQLIKENLFPVNSVFSTTSENSYPSLPNASWSLLGTQEIGGSTIYYYKRIS